MSTQIITVKLRLSDKHSAGLSRQARAVNKVFNYCNETSGKAWSRDKKWLTGLDLQKLTSGSSKIIGLHAQSIQRVCNVFAKARDKAKRATLRWRGVKALGWVPFNTGNVKYRDGLIWFNGEGYRPLHLHPKLAVDSKICAGSFNSDARGRWYISLPVEIDCSEHSSDTKVGIDLGLKDLAVLSDGQKIATPSLFRASECALGTAQRARKTKRSQAIHAKVAARRKDFLHKASAALAKEYGLIVVGDVSPSKLAKTAMAKSVLDAGWSDFKRMLSYKARMHGGRVVEVSERYTSQICSACGSMPPGRPKGIADLGKRVWECEDCGTVHDRDVNAARNILAAGLGSLRLGAPQNTPGSSQKQEKASL